MIHTFCWTSEAIDRTWRIITKKLLRQLRSWWFWRSLALLTDFRSIPFRISPFVVNEERTKGGWGKEATILLVPARFRRNSVEKSSGKARWKSSFIGPRYFDASLNSFKRRSFSHSVACSWNSFAARQYPTPVNGPRVFSVRAGFVTLLEFRVRFSIQPRFADKLTDLVRILRWMPRLFPRNMYQHLQMTSKRIVSRDTYVCNVVSRSCRLLDTRKILECPVSRIDFIDLTRVNGHGGRRWQAFNLHPWWPD